MNLKKYLVLFVVLIIGLCVPAAQVYATSVTNNNLGIKLEFLEKYAVISKAGVHEKNGLTDQEIQQLTQILTDSNIELIAISQNDLMEINIESFANATSSNTFTFLTDAELLEFGKELHEGIMETMENIEGSENAEVQYPEIYHHSQTNFILFKGTNLGINTFQYFTIYNGKGYRFLLVDYNGNLKASEAESFIDDINFLKSPINNPSNNSSNATLKWDYDAIFVNMGKGALMGAFGTIPYLFYRKKKKRKANQED